MIWVLGIIQSYLETLQKQFTINDYRVAGVRELTWEEAYPCMPIRLLAIEAVELFGSTICAKELPRHLWRYPYTKQVDWMIVGRTEDGDYYREFYTTTFSEDDMPEKELRPDQMWENFIRWVIDEPYQQLIVDIYIQPVKPVEYIKLEFKTCT